MHEALVRGGALIAGLGILLGVAGCSDKAAAPLTTSAPGDASTPTLTAASGTTTAPTPTPVETTVRQATPLTVEELVRRAEPAIVRIQTSTGVGTGFIVREDGYIVTNNHVVAGRTGRPQATVAVTLSDGATLTGTVVGTDPRSDLAVVKIDGTGYTPLPLGKLSEVSVGEDVVAIGYALDLRGGEGPSYSVTRGIVSAKNRAISETASIAGAIQTDAAINHGNSGGPLLNMQGEVIGVNTAIAPDPTTGEIAQGIGFAVGVDTVSAVADELIADGLVSRGFLGISNFTALRPATARSLGIPESQGGVYLASPDSLVAGGPALTGGLQVGDVIIRIGSTPIVTESDLAVAMIRHAPNEQVEVEVYRGGSTRTLTVTLGTPPA